MKHRSGAVLLEALVALLVVALVLPGFVLEMRELDRLSQRVSERNRRVREADRLLQSVTLWSTAELDRRLGSRVQGPWTLEVHRDVGGWYAVTIRERGAGGRALFATATSGAMP